MWIARAVETELVALVEDDDARLVTVFGLAGTGASTTVARIVGARAVRVDLRGVTRAADAHRRLDAIRARVVWLDDVHRPDAVRAAAEALAGRSRVFVSARGPLGSSIEHRVALGAWSHQETSARLSSELRRRGARAGHDVEALARHADGWPTAASAFAIEARLAGPRPLDPARIHRRAAGVRAALDAAWSSLRVPERALLVALAASGSGVDVADVLADREDGAPALDRLVDLGLCVAVEGRIRVRRPVRAHVLDRPDAGPTGTARRRGEALLLASASRARDAHRRDPAHASTVLARLHDDLVRIVHEGPPRAAVEAALCLEPLLVGGLARAEVVSLFQLAAHRARRVGVDARARTALALARTFLHRGEHETAESILLAATELSSTPLLSAHRAIYLAHVAAWRGRLEDARRGLDEADAHVAAAAAETPHDLARCVAVEEDVAIQRAFVAFQRDDLDEAERVSRLCATMAARGPSPRLGALARRFAAEILLRRGEAARAVPLFEQTRDELLHFGDRAGWLFVWSRMVEAMRVADDPRASTEARAVAAIAARAGEGPLELAVLEALRGDDVDAGRVGELAWRTQIPVLRDQAERWLAARAPGAKPRRLRLDARTQRAWLDDRTASFARRETLWRILAALAEAYPRTEALPFTTLFAVGWPGERAEPASQRKRVQTAVWTLRRAILGEDLSTLPEGYVLARGLRVDHDGGAARGPV